MIVAGLRRLLRHIAHTRIENERALTGYVLRICSLCIVLAVTIDVANQMAFFIDWPTTIRSWIISAIVALVIAAPVSHFIGKAHLELYRAKQRAEELGRLDPLTGLLNRRALFEHAAAVDVIALVIVDIDRFKSVNDAFGHLIGDEVLRAVAHMLARLLGDCGEIGRLGGEEFAIVSNVVDVARLSERLEEFRASLSRTPIVSGTTTVNVTVSVGIAARRPDQSFEQLYADADKALYSAKRAGRNRIVVHDGSAHDRRLPDEAASGD